MIKEIYLNFCEIILSIIILTKILLIVIEKYFSIINRVLIQNNFIIILLLKCFLLSIIEPINILNNILINLIYFVNVIKINKSILLIKLILLFCYFLLNILLLKKLKNTEKEIKLDQIFILDFLVLNSFFLISTTNFFELLLCLEINNIIFLILATTKNFQLNAIEAAFKYFFLGAITTTFYLLGVFFIYYSTGLIYFDEIKLFLFHEFLFLNDNLLLSFGFILIIISFLLKLGFFPLHKIIIDFYGNIPFIFLPFFQIFGQLPILVMIFFLFNDLLLFLNNSYFVFFLIIFSLINILIGTILGSDQDTIKRFIANSSIQFNGFAILLLSFLKSDIFLIFINYYIAYLLGYFALVFFLNALLEKNINLIDYSNLNEITLGINSLNVSYPLRFFLFVLLVSLSGIPLTFIFISKSLLFFLVIEDITVYFILFFLCFITIFLLNFYITFFVNFLLGLKERFIITYLYEKNKLLFTISFTFLILGIIVIFFIYDILYLFAIPENNFFN